MGRLGLPTPTTAVTQRFVLVWFAILLALAACGATAGPPPNADPVAEGRRLFTIWCSGCHAIEPGAPAGIGPDLAGVAGRAAANSEGLTPDEWLRRETLEPNSVITPGYPPGLMPTDYGERLRPEQIDALIAFMLTLE